MGNAGETMHRLMKIFDIAPAGTREEGDAARALSEVFHEHGLATAAQSFNYSSLGKVGLAGCAILVGVAGILSGVATGVLPIIALVVGLIAAAAFILEHLGIKTVSRLPLFSGSSQNIVARHPGASPAKDDAPARPVVIVAHYDTPRADIFALPLLAWSQPYLGVATFVCVCVVAVNLLFQVLPLPLGLQSFAWALALIASALLIVWGGCTLAQRFLMPFTMGANDNKASIAAMFELLERVRPIKGGHAYGPEDAARARAAVATSADEPAAGKAASPDAAARARALRERMGAAKRHGADVVRSLGIVPESCQIVYETGSEDAAPRVHRVSAAAGQAVKAAAVNEPTVLISAPAADESLRAPVPAPEAVAAPAPEPVAFEPLTPEGAKEAVADALMATVMAAAEPESPTSLIAPASPSEDLVSQLVDATGANKPMPAELMGAQEVYTASLMNDPAWGTSSFMPVRAGRGILGDVPDPAVAAVDPFSVAGIEAVGTYNPEDFSTMDFETGTHQAITPAMLEQARVRNLDGFTSEITDQPAGKRGRKGKRARKGNAAAEPSLNEWLQLDANYNARTSGEQLGSWQNFANDQAVSAPQAPQAADPYGQFAGSQYGQQPQQPNPYGGAANGGYYPPNQANNPWQGGAARAQGSTASADDARRAAMSLGDRALASREIWFVLTGASEADHAGIADFLETYRKDVTGAYFINLECVGAGRQSIVVEEGFGRAHVKADRRLANLLGKASLAINRPLQLARMNWRDTDATPLLREGCRAVTICGVKSGAPANACWVGDTPDKVDLALIEDAVDIVAETIKGA